MKLTPILPILVLSTCITSVTEADVQMPPIFSDQMILQQKTNNAIWGLADAGEKITVKSSWGEEGTAVADSTGHWKVLLKSPAHGVGYSLKVTGKNTLEFKDVAIGEVWLCAGQSNMGFSLGHTYGGEEEAAKANAPTFRIFKSAREHWHEPLDIPRDRLSKWRACTPESAAETSAVSYYFGKKIHAELGVPVGIIVQAYAGTPIEGWMPWDVQKNNPRSQFHKKELDETSERQRSKLKLTKEKALKKYQKDLAQYNKKIDAGETMKNKVRPLTPPIITKPAVLGHQYPAHMFNVMIHSVLPYGIRGAIWYQGERNSKDVPQAVAYRKQLPMMIQCFRTLWNKGSGGNVADDFSFFFTQLPSWNAPQEKPVEGLEAPWAVNREMMRLVARDTPNTGVAVSIDTGDPVALHPHSKKPIGLRLAYLALKQTYDKKLVDYGPRYIKQTVKGSQIILEFNSIGGGMVPAKKGKLDAFAIAGSDQKWHWGDAQIDGSTVVVSSKEVAKPVAVRYAWAMNPSQRNLLYNKEGIPASPFRTDDWPLFKEGDEVIRVNKPKKERGYEGKDWSRPKMSQ